MAETDKEKLSHLYRDVDECARCGLADDNPPPRLRFKFGTRPILLVGQNPGCRVVHGCNHIWGGLDFLRTRTGDEESLALLDEVLDAVWITNVVKCRTDEDRPPHVREENACLEFLIKEIGYIKPVKVIALGSVAQEWLGRNEIDFIPADHPGHAVRRGCKAVEKYIGRLHSLVLD